MKIRNGFVSNSSSSSFIVMTRDLYTTGYQATILEKRGVADDKFIHTRDDLDQAIADLYDLGKEEEWAVDDYKGYLLFHSWMDNFDMKQHIANTFCAYPVLDIIAHSGFIEHEDRGLIPGGDTPEVGMAIRNLRFIVDNCFYEQDKER